MIYMRSKKLLPFHAQQSTYLSTMQLHIRLHCTIATMQSSTMQLHNYKFLVFRLISFLHDMNGIGILSTRIVQDATMS